MKKKLLSILAAAMIACTSISMPNASGVASAEVKVSLVSDISGHWAESSINKMIKLGFVGGYSDGSFKPNASITRAEFIKMTVNVLQLPVPSSGGKWYEPFVSAAVTAGVHQTKDYNGNYDRAITRLEMAKIVARAAKTSLRTGKETDAQLMYEATKLGVVNGLANGDLGKSNNSTRAEAVVMSDRLLTIQQGGTLKVDKRAASYAEVEYRHTNIETMWGGSMNPLPQTHDFSYSVKGTFEEILIIDLSDKNSPYRNWVTDDLVKIDRTDWQNDYLVAMKVKMKNTKLSTSGSRLYIYNLLGNPNFTRAVLTEKSTPISTINFLPMDKYSEVTTWHLIAISKSELEKIKAKNLRFWYFDWNSSNYFQLSTDGRIFGK